MDRINWKAVFGVVGVTCMITATIVFLTVWAVNNTVSCHV